MRSKISAPSLTSFLKGRSEETNEIPEKLIKLLEAIASIGVIVQNDVARCISFIQGVDYIASYNASYDLQQPIDIIAHNHFIHNLKKLNVVCAILSEESKEAELLNDNGTYLVAIDPIDGSSNIAVNGTTGTIFSVYQKKTEAPLTNEDLLQQGSQQIAAGYLLYGVATLFVISLGKGVHLFTYDKVLDCFLLTRSSITIPQDGIFYAVNDSSFGSFPQKIKKYLQLHRSNLNARYFGALVSDFHQILIKGGIYMYPPTQKYPNGKLRLLFECNPLAFIAKQAKGMALSEAQQPVLMLQPTTIHQQIPLYIGSTNMVHALMDLYTAKE